MMNVCMCIYVYIYIYIFFGGSSQADSRLRGASSPTLSNISYTIPYYNIL